jgi:glycyl-tRNA synthetase beta chain
LDAGDYSGNLMAMATIKSNVDRFFDQVMVMVDDEKIRTNRAGVLQELGVLMNQVADISKLAA